MGLRRDRYEVIAVVGDGGADDCDLHRRVSAVTSNLMQGADGLGIYKARERERGLIRKMFCEK
jgi:hypothetical protein